MNKRKVILIMSVLTFLLLLIGASYAFFTAQISGVETASTISLNGGELQIVFDGGANITAQNLIPSSNPWATKTFTITGTNNTNLNVPYYINLIVDTNTFSTNAIKYSLTGTNTNNNGQIASTVTMNPINSTTKIGTGYFQNGTSKKHSYTLNLYFPVTASDQTKDMGKSISLRLNITAAAANLGS